MSSSASMVAEPRTLLAARVSRAEAVSRQVESEIAGGTLARGERMGTKDDLRRRYGVAVATVNEAVRLLEVRGLVETRPGPGGGIFVADPLPQARRGGGIVGFDGETATLAELLEVRNALEPLVCAEGVRYLRPGDLRALTRILGAMERRRGDGPALMKLTLDLHRRIARACRNAPLHSIYLTVLDYIEDRHGRAGLERVDGDLCVAVHRELVDAIAAGGGSRLERALADHAGARLSGTDQIRNTLDA
jgi:DNA-binding FadR family transcriptional regulator